MNLPNPPKTGSGELDTWLARLHDAVQAQRLKSGPGMMLSRGTDGTGIKIPQSKGSNTFFHPFKIYPAALTTGDDTARPWRYWSVRGGLIDYPSLTVISAGIAGAAIRGIAANGADGVAGGLANRDWFTQSTKIDPDIDLEDVTVSNTGDHAVSNVDNAGRFVLDPTPDSLYCVGAAFWLEGNDPITSGDFTEWAVKCRMWAFAPLDPTGRTTNSFPPDAPNIIPIGLVTPPNGMNGGSPGDPTSLVTDQYLTAHLINRRPPNPAWYSNLLTPDFVPGGRGPTNWRGYWEATDAFGMAGQTYYDGDLVTVRTTGETVSVVGGGGGTVTLSDYWQTFVHQGVAVETVIPVSGGARWQPLNGP